MCVLSYKYKESTHFDLWLVKRVQRITVLRYTSVTPLIKHENAFTQRPTSLVLIQPFFGISILYISERSFHILNFFHTKMKLACKLLQIAFTACVHHHNARQPTKSLYPYLIHGGGEADIRRWYMHVQLLRPPLYNKKQFYIFSYENKFLSPQVWKSGQHIPIPQPKFEKYKCPPQPTTEASLGSI